MRIITAFQAFFVLLFNKEKAGRIVPVLKGESPPLLETDKQSHQSTKRQRVPDQSPQCQQGDEQAPSKPAKRDERRQSEAITLLAALQREARFLDFLMEKLDGYDDAQVGAAARSVHAECAAVIARMFDVQPLRTEPEMSQITVGTGCCAGGIDVGTPTGNSGLVQLVGNVSGHAPWTGRLTHCGWIAKKCELPTWSGTPESALVLAPAEVEI